MTINYKILGEIFQDNALKVKVETGQQVYHLLFDCGEGCLHGKSVSEIHGIEHLCFSHFHMDHVAGFDSFFRHNFAPDRPVQVWGPQQTIEIMHNRFRGFVWNLVEGAQGTWVVNEVSESKIQQASFETAESFKSARNQTEKPFDGVLIKNEHFQLQACIMDHLTPSLAYKISESPRQHFHAERLAEMGLKGGEWIANLKRDSTADSEIFEFEKQKFTAGELREKLLSEKAGTSLAYLTDFKLDQPTRENLLEMLGTCETIICESQYSDEDVELAKMNHHLTVSESAKIAADAGAKKLILFHLSSRYDREKAIEILNLARESFPEAYYPEHWMKQEIEG